MDLRHLVKTNINETDVKVYSLKMANCRHFFDQEKKLVSIAVMN
jgi:hypothetical protein